MAYDNTKKEVRKVSDEERNKMLEGTLKIKDFTLGDFLNSAGEKDVKENGGAKRDKEGNKVALYKSEIADKDVIVDLYVPMVAKFKSELGKATTQEEFNDVIDNFGKREIENITKEKNEILDELNEKTGKEYKSFKEIPESDIDEFSTRVKKTYEEGNQIEKLLEIDNLDKIALRPSTYAFTKNTDTGKMYDNILETLSETNIAKFIDNNETLKQKVVILDKDGEVKNQVVYKMVEKENKGETKEVETDGKQSRMSQLKGSSNKESVQVEQPHLHNIADNLKVAILNEVSDLKDNQTKEIISMRKGEIEEISFDPIESVNLVLSKDFDKRYKVKGENGEVDEEKTNLGKEVIKDIQNNVSALFPKIDETNALEVLPSAKIASINPSLLKEKQEINSAFAGEMVKNNLSVVRELPDKVVAYKSVTLAIESKINNTKTSQSTKEFAKKQLEYVDAVKSGKKDEFLAKEKAEREEKNEKAEKNSVEEATENQKKSEKEVKEQLKEDEKNKAVENTGKEYNGYEDEEFEINGDEINGDDGMPF